jgi:hypothetical protein
MKPMNKDTHVYCTDCIYGEELIQSIEDFEPMPCACCSCYSLDPEDSCPFEFRKNYIPLEQRYTISPEIQARMPKPGSKPFNQRSVFEVLWQEIKSFFN